MDSSSQLRVPTDEEAIDSNVIVLSESSQVIEIVGFPRCECKFLSSLVPHLFSTEILSFLNTRELSMFSQCSRRTHELSKDTYLWSCLYSRDFDSEMPHLDNEMFSSTLINRPLQCKSKIEYMERYQRIMDSIALAKEDKIKAKLNLRRQHRINMLERCLDIVQLRLLTPLPFIASFTSILLFALHIDGLNISIWVCASPLLFVFFYATVCIVQIVQAHRLSSREASLYHGLWAYIRGPVHVVVKNVMQFSFQTRIALLVFVMALAQVLLVAMKLSPNQAVQSHITRALPWGAVFLPVWILLIIYICMPYLGFCRRDATLHSLGTCFLWIPLTVLFTLLAVKLTYIDGQSGGTSSSSGSSNVRLAEMFVPLWVVEIGNMLVSLVYLAFGAYKAACGLLGETSLRDYFGVFLSSWLFLGPFVIFQALLAARDDGRSRDLSGDTEPLSLQATVAPMLLLLAWYSFFVIFVTYRLRTPLQVRRDALRVLDSGLRELFLI